MEPALDVVNRALLGDFEAHSFLERTSSSYVLDVSDPRTPKTYGCWNLIHQIMNEVERYEAAYMRHSDDPVHSALSRCPVLAGLVPHVRLLASMALRVARRSPCSDKALVLACIRTNNSSSTTTTCHTTEAQSQWLIDLNLELREIVIGRIAATAFDFTFHRRVGEAGYSAFGDGVVRDALCAVLSANAVAGGPASIRHFSTEWIIPSSSNLPVFALASVVHHLALEGSRKTAPAGTKDMLQQLSMQAMSVVLVPVLVNAVSDNTQSVNGTIAKCFLSMTSWCGATDLSLPQIRHICNKAQIDVVGVINDAMYSDSADVIDALALFIETLVAEAIETPVPIDRMNQVRHIIQADQSSFAARFSLDQLKIIELKEMEAIVQELVSAIGLQQLRFSERQNSGQHDMCRNLTRIASAICTVCVDQGNGINVHPHPGIMELLRKATSHTHVHISAIALCALIDAARQGYDNAESMLSTLQRRAIVPYLILQQSGKLTLSAHDLSGVSFQEFDHFRNGVLTDYLLLCWRVDADLFMNSCMAAVEEFCYMKQHISPEISLQLEAALFCIEIISREAMSTGRTIHHSKQLTRIVSAIGARSGVIFSNLVTLSRMCSLIQQLARWLQTNGMAVAAAELAIEAFRAGDANGEDIKKETGISVLLSSSRALKELCLASAKDLVQGGSLRALEEVWKESCLPRNSTMDVEARLAICSGICSVISSLPVMQQSHSLDSMSSCLLASFESAIAAARVTERSPLFELSLSNLTRIISVMACFPRTVASIGPLTSGTMQSGCDTASDRHLKLPAAVMKSLQNALSRLDYVCKNFVMNDEVASSLCNLLSNWLPPPPLDDSEKALVGELLSLAKTMAASGKGSARFVSVFLFLERFIQVYGVGIERAALTTLSNSEDSVEYDRELGLQFQDVIVLTVNAARSYLGIAWSQPKEQRHGQVPFESKAIQPLVETVANESLSCVFSFTAECLVTCPLFLLHLSVVPGPNQEHDIFFRRVVESAISALNDGDPEITRSAMRVLKAAIRKATFQQIELQAIVSDILSRRASDILSRVLFGVCGKMERQLLGDTADLLTAILQDGANKGIETQLITILRQDFFQLGHAARTTVVAVFRGCADHQINSSVLNSLLETMWDLHQVEDTDALPSSESVARLVNQYKHSS